MDSGSEAVNKNEGLLVEPIIYKRFCCHVNSLFWVRNHAIGYVSIIYRENSMPKGVLKISKLWTVVLGIGLFSVIFTAPYQATVHSRSGRDYASYHYAVQAVTQNVSPYDVDQLNRLAKKEGARRTVHPFFYPPPAILSVMWVNPLTLLDGYHAFFWFNQCCLLLTLYVIRRWRKTSWNILLAGTLLLWPVFDTMKMGQLNLFVGLMMVVALRHTSGLALSVAAMTKMSPALLFFAWVMDKRWKAVYWCALGCVGLSILSFPWVSLSAQWDFYTQILPEFSSGAYHGLTIPINIPANHSIPDLYNQLFPGETQTKLSSIAKSLSSITSVLILSSLLLLIRKVRMPDSKLFVSLSLIPLMLVTPVYCYEHHLALLLLPIVLCLETLSTKSVSWRVVGWSVLAFGGQPLFSLRWLQKKIGVGEWLFQESKFMFILIVGIFCVWRALQIERESLVSSS